MAEREVQMHTCSTCSMPAVISPQTCRCTIEYFERRVEERDRQLRDAREEIERLRANQRPKDPTVIDFDPEEEGRKIADAVIRAMKGEVE